jgi:hypothetical protein
MRALSLSSLVNNSVLLSRLGIAVSQALVFLDLPICLACMRGALALISAAVNSCLLSSLHLALLQVVFTLAVCAMVLKRVWLKSIVTSSSVLFSEVSKVWLAVVVGSGIPRPPCCTDRAISLRSGAMFSRASFNRAGRKCSDMAFSIGVKAVLMSRVTRSRNSHLAWRDLVSPAYAVWGKCLAMRARARTL